MDAMKDALMKRRMKMAELEMVDPQEESLQEAEMGLLGSEEMPLDDQEEGTDLAPAIDKAGQDQYQAEMDMKAAMSNGGPQNEDGGDARSSELADLEKMFEGGRDMNNKGFMGKAAMKMKDRLAMLKK